MTAAMKPKNQVAVVAAMMSQIERLCQAASHMRELDTEPDALVATSEAGREMEALRRDVDAQRLAVDRLRMTEPLRRLDRLLRAHRRNAAVIASEMDEVDEALARVDGRRLDAVRALDAAMVEHAVLEHVIRSVANDGQQ